MYGAPAAGGLRRYLLVAGGLTLAYLIVVPVLWLNRGVVERGPISFTAPTLNTTLEPGQLPEQVEDACTRHPNLSNIDYARMKVVGGRVQSRVLYGCYAVGDDGAVKGAAVLDQDLLPVKDVSLLKQSGAWRWIGGVKTKTEVVLGLLGVVGILSMYMLYYRRARPGS